MDLLSFTIQYKAALKEIDCDGHWLHSDLEALG